MKPKRKTSSGAMIPFFEDDFARAPESVPVFPLPEMVLLPGEPLPLHIFEERYKKMADAAVSSERLIAMAHLKPGWERDYEGNPEVYEVAGLGKIIVDERLPDGRFNLLLFGLRRIRIKRFVQETPYRRAEIQILSDLFSQTSSTVIAALESEIIALAQELLKRGQHLSPNERDSAPAVENLIPGSLPLGHLCDLVAASFALAAQEKQLLLEETDVIHRTKKLRFALQFRLQSPPSGTDLRNDLH